MQSSIHKEYQFLISSNTFSWSNSQVGDLLSQFTAADAGRSCSSHSHSEACPAPPQASAAHQTNKNSTEKKITYLIHGTNKPHFNEGLNNYKR